MTEKIINIDMKKTFDLWIEITGVNPSQTTIRLRDMDIQRANRILEKSLKYDSTYMTTLMLMTTYLEEFMETRTLSLKEITDNYSTFTDWLFKVSELINILNSEYVMSAKQEFKNLLKEALSHYGIEESVYDSMVANESYLSELRYSSFNAIQDLEVVQFAQGSPIANKPRIYKDVFIFKDINTLLRWMMSVDSGIVVAMIQDTKDLSNSYFVFAVRNGGTLSILTDREKLSHPLQMETSRSRMRGRASED
ncbi:hypothetical protein [Bacillus sonorensis]|uniref:hypothetical protein n=1 Tax=Bacillus sonorensis TaxID=119858 RepID=UPI002DC025B2|nr:hypothetical protein [Bacillus sonorensis]MEC0342003.1 hypothetical protein [Bacillus sonorensis]MEC0457483.1 hypothetical protein [Bacillus sonorensis]MEC0530722.1 hypothetical protein [Bacillus sonorensis]